MVCFRPNRPLSNADVELITIFLENEKQSSGGDIQSQVYDQQTNLLKVTFENVKTKERVLKKRVFMVLNFELIAFEYIDQLSIFNYSNELNTLNKSAFLLKNMGQNEDLSVLTLYVEYLEPEVELDEIQRSKIFKDTILVKFKNELNINEVKNRLQKKSTFLGKQVDLYEVFNSNLCVFKLINDNLNETLVKLFELVNVRSIYLIGFDTKFEFLVLKIDPIEINDKSKELLEVVYNFELFDKNQLEIQFEEKLKIHENSQYELKTQLDQKPIVDEKHKPKLETQKSNTSPVNLQPANRNLRYSIKLEFESPICFALTNCKKIYNDFKKSLKKFNTNLIKNEPQSAYIIESLSSQKVTADEWFKQISGVIEEYENKINFAKLYLNNPQLSNQLKDIIQAINAEDPEICIYLTENFLSMIGYEKNVVSNYNHFKSRIDPNVSQEQKVPKSAQPLEEVYVYRAHNPLFHQLILENQQIKMDINQNVKKLNASIVISEDGTVMFKPINPQLKQSLEEWRKQIAEHVQIYYSRQIYTKKLSINEYGTFTEVDLQRLIDNWTAKQVKRRNFVFKIDIKSDVLELCGFKHCIRTCENFLANLSKTDGESKPRTKSETISIHSEPSSTDSSSEKSKKSIVSEATEELVPKVRIDIFLGKYLLVNEKAFAELNQHLSSNNACLAKVNEKLQAQRVEKGRQKIEDWKTNVKTIISKYRSKSFLMESFVTSKLDDAKKIELNSELKLLETRYLDRFFFKLHGQAKYLIIYGAKEVLKTVSVDLRKKYPIEFESKNRDKQEAKEKQTKNQASDYKLIINLKSDPRMIVLSQLKQTYLNDLCTIFERDHGIKCELMNNDLKLVSLNDKIHSEKTLEQWKKDVRGYIKKYFDRFSCSTVNIEDNLQFNYDAKLLYIKKLSNNKLEVVGLTENVKKLIGAIGTCDKPKNLQPIEQFIENLNQDQMNKLFSHNYFFSMSETFKHLVILLDTNNRRLHFKGNQHDIQLAMNATYQLLKN